MTSLPFAYSRKVGNMQRWIIRMTIMAALVAFFVPAAQAQDLGFVSAGIRGGLNTYPNQFQFGGQINAGEFFPNVRFQPSVTFGIGDERKIFMVNIDSAYYVPIDGATWNPYIGGGLGIGIESFDDDASKDKVKAGLNIMGGIEWGMSRTRYFVEMRTQIGTSMGDFTVLGGVNF